MNKPLIAITGASSGIGEEIAKSRGDAVGGVVGVDDAGDRFSDTIVRPRLAARGGGAHDAPAPTGGDAY